MTFAWGLITKPDTLIHSFTLHTHLFSQSFVRSSIHSLLFKSPCILSFVKFKYNIHIHIDLHTSVCVFGNWLFGAVCRRVVFPSIWWLCTFYLCIYCCYCHFIECQPFYNFFHLLGCCFSYFLSKCNLNQIYVIRYHIPFSENFNIIIFNVVDSIPFLNGVWFNFKYYSVCAKSSLTCKNGLSLYIQLCICMFVAIAAGHFCK